MDLQVYVDAGRALLKGYDVVNLRFTDNGLSFIYPTFALLLAVPISWLPLGFLQVAFTLVSVLLLRVLLRRFGVPAGLPIAVIGTVIVLLCQPVRATLGYGQVNVMVAAFVLIDLLPGRRLGPRGFLTGIAAGIKLTPALFGDLPAVPAPVPRRGVGLRRLRGHDRRGLRGPPAGEHRVLATAGRRRHQDRCRVLPGQPVRARWVRPALPLLRRSGGRALPGAVRRRGDRAGRLHRRRRLDPARRRAVRPQPGRDGHADGVTALVDPPLRLRRADGVRAARAAGCRSN